MISLLLLAFAWLLTGCAIAWVIGRASDLGATSENVIKHSVD